MASHPVRLKAKTKAIGMPYRYLSAALWVDLLSKSLQCISCYRVSVNATATYCTAFTSPQLLGNGSCRDDVATLE
jgi:hypothetical protein